MVVEVKVPSLSSVILFLDQVIYKYFRIGLVIARPNGKRTSAKAKPPSGKAASGRSHTKADTEGIRHVHNTRK